MPGGARARAGIVLAELEAMPPPFHYSTWIAEDTTRDAVHMLLGPVLVRTCAKATCGLMLSCTTWRNALKPLVIEFMKELNKKFAAAQIAQFDMDRRGPINRSVAISEIMSEPDAHALDRSTLEQDEDNPRVAEKLRQLQEAIRVKRDAVIAYKEHSECFDHSTVAHALKMAVMCAGANGDPRQLHLHEGPNGSGGGRDTRQMTPYILGDQTVHAYAAMGMRRCEVCGPLGMPCSRDKTTFFHAPYAQGAKREHMRLLRCASECVGKQCMLWNCMSQHPLQTTTVVYRRAARVLEDHSQHNNNLLASALRHVSVPSPPSEGVLGKRMRPDDYDLVSKEGALFKRAAGDVNVFGDGETANAEEANRRWRWESQRRIDERSMRVFWLATHPTMPATYSMQYKLRVPDSALVLARGDLKRQANHDADVATLVAQKHMEKLMADVHCLFATKPGLRAQNVTTIDEVDSFYPGAHATLKRILKTDRDAPVEHALDLPFTRLFVSIVEMAMVDMRRMDQSLCPNGRTASGHAVAWLTGLSIGSIPGVSLQDVSGKLNDDPRAIRIKGGEDPMSVWRLYVTTAHLFDALQWNNLTVDKCEPSRAGGSNDPMPSGGTTGTGIYYHIKIGMGAQMLDIRSLVTYRNTRAEWISIRDSAQKLCDECNLNAILPAVPSQEHIDELFEFGNDATLATNWIEVMAQTLAFWPCTRAMGLEVLTNFSTRGVIAAVHDSGIDLDLLDAVIAVKVADDDPME
jgi:hypothetical protein